MKLRRICVAALVVAISSFSTVSAASYQVKVPTSQVVSCPTDSTTGVKGANAVQNLVNQALKNQNNQSTKNCTAPSLVPDLSEVLSKAAACRQNGSGKTVAGTVATQSSLPVFLQKMLEQCGIKLPAGTSVPGISDKTDDSCESKPVTSTPTPSQPDCSSTPAPSQPDDSSTPAPSQPDDSSTPAPSQPDDSSTPAPSQPDNSSSTPSKPDDSQTGTPSDTLTYEEQVVALVNQERAKNGLKPLTMNLKLSNVARAKSQDMRDNNYFSHTSPTYGSPFDMMKSFGISYRTAGENIAMGYRTPEAVMQGWMNSPGHRANILNGSFTEIGVGYVADGNYWTQQFIG